ncbi:MAG: thiamine diphosphokinase [Firmicutes bacterium]|jgi:thiamine pyrophosphokinase|nr:thiamine diphosphokinase [Bacillota bacterium]
MSKAVIITNGTINDYSFIKDLIDENQDFIICADGGIKHASKAGIDPHAIIGDFDSAAPETLTLFKQKGIPIIRYPANKDKSDTELALDYAVENGYKELLLIGGFGDRMDHSLANIMLLISLSLKGFKVRAIDEKNDLQVCLDEVKITGKEGDYISLIPITSKVIGVTTHGLFYRLKNADLEFGSSLSLSNRLTAENGWVKIQDGVLLVIKARD